QGFGTGQTLTQADVDALNNRQQDPDVVAAIPISQTGGQITYGSQNYFAPTTGTTPEFPQVRDYQLADGSFFTQADINARPRVVVLDGHAGRDRDHDHPPAAAPDLRPDPGRLSAPEPAGHPQPGDVHRHRAHARAGRHRRHLARRRRHRNHEHHAGHRHRTNA